MSQPGPVAGAEVRPGSLRADLQTSEQLQRGRRYTVIKNPLTLTYFRLPSEHFEAAASFDGKRTLAEATALLRDRHPYWRTLPEDEAVAELSQLATQLASAGLLHIAGSGATTRTRRIGEMTRRRRFEQWVGSILYFRKALLDPDKLLARMLPWFGWVYTRPAAWIFAGLLMVTAWMLVDNGSELTTQAVNFFTLQNLFLSWVLFMAVKVVHEFGHGLTCKKYGGEVHEMGFLFILLTPYLYCDVSDSWMVSSRARRVAVTAAGMVAELFLACVAAWLWHLLQPGLGRQLCFNTMVICSISTILFNANPLMKFDGYYIVTDLLEIPNLRQKGNAVVAGFFSHHLLGLPPSRETMTAHERSALFGLYAVAAYAYGWWITFHIAAVVFDKLEPYGLGFLSRGYVGLFLFVSVALPLWRLLQGWKTAGVQLQRPGGRRLLILGGGGAFLLLLLLLPWKDGIRAGCVIESATRSQVMPGQPGWLNRWFVREGEQVAAGQPLAELENPALADALGEATLELEAAEVQWRAALNSSSEEIRLAAPALQKNVDGLREKVRGLSNEVAAMTIRSPQEGIVIMPGMDRLPGQYFPKGRLLVRIDSERDFQAILPLDEKQARKVAIGDLVTIRLKSNPSVGVKGRVLVIPSQPSEEFSNPALSNLLGGDFPSEQDKRAGGIPRPAVACYEVVAALDSSAPISNLLRPGLTGSARVVIRSSTLGGWIGRCLLDWINPDLRL